MPKPTKACRERAAARAAEARAQPNNDHLIVRLPSDVLADFRAYCEKDGSTMSELVRNFIWWQVALNKRKAK